MSTLQRITSLWKFDESTLVLILANVVTILMAVFQHWDIKTVLWIYWSQSVIIGIFNFFRIFGLKNFTTKGFKINGRPAQPTAATKRFTAIFFLLHYGIFHFVYLLFLVSRSRLDSTVIIPVFIAILAFLVNHAFSFFRNYQKDIVRKQNIGKVMFFPYARIFPMHFIISGSLFGGSVALVLFLILKTVADVIMHQVEHTQGKGVNLFHV